MQNRKFFALLLVGLLASEFMVSDADAVVRKVWGKIACMLWRSCNNAEKSISEAPESFAREMSLVEGNPAGETEETEAESDTYPPEAPEAEAEQSAESLKSDDEAKSARTDSLIVAAATIDATPADPPKKARLSVKELVAQHEKRISGSKTKNKNPKTPTDLGIKPNTVEKRVKVIEENLKSGGEAASSQSHSKTDHKTDHKESEKSDPKADSKGKPGADHKTDLKNKHKADDNKPKDEPSTSSPKRKKSQRERILAMERELNGEIKQSERRSCICCGKAKYYSSSTDTSSKPTVKDIIKGIENRLASESKSKCQT